MTLDFVVGDLMVVSIIDEGNKGDGVARAANGKRLIIPGAKKGEKHLVKIVRISPKYAFAISQERYWT